MDYASDTSLSPEQGGIFHLDALIGHWSRWEDHESFYLNELLPSLMRDPSSGDSFEQKLLKTLKSRLTEGEWIELPNIVARRRKEDFDGFSIDLGLAEMQRVASVSNNLKKLISNRSWESFDQVFYAANLPDSKRQEIQQLKKRERREEKREQEVERQQKTVLALRTLLEKYDWVSFDRQLTDANLPAQAHGELLAFKAQKTEEQRTERDQAITDELHSLLEHRNWADFDEALLKAELPASELRELRDFRVRKLEQSRKEEARQKRLLAIKELRSLITQHNWALFDGRLAEAPIDRDGRESLLREKADALTSRIPAAFQPDKHQARILASPAKTMRVTARAGSGKTRLLTALTYF